MTDVIILRIDHEMNDQDFDRFVKGIIFRMMENKQCKTVRVSVENDRKIQIEDTGDK